MLTKEQLDALRGHTPGPWCNVDYSLSNEIKTLRNPLIAIVQSRYCDSPEELRTNAALIAAAPDLIEHIDKQRAEIDAIRRSMRRLLLCDDVAEGVKVYLRLVLQEAEE